MRKVSIITVSYNSASTIRETIKSVLSQSYPHIEYIVIDGASTDGTQQIIESFGDRINRFVSEKDNGLYDAMNKGIRMATGDIVGIINSDDLYESTSSIANVMKAFEEYGTDCVYGELYYFGSENPEKPLRYYKVSDFKPSKISMGILPPHPTFFVKREVYEKFGVFDTTFRYAADFDLMARFLYVHRITYHYLPMTLVKMRLGGVSTQGLRRIIQINKEDMASCKKNNIKTNFLLFHLKYFFKFAHVTSLRYFFE